MAPFVGAGHFGSADRRLRPEPIAFAVPRRDGPPFMLDVCMSVVAGGKIEQKNIRGEPLPDGWLIDHDGNYVNQTTLYGNPEANGVLPLGGLQFGHKGHGLAMMVETTLYGNPEANGVLPLGGLQFGHKGHGLAMMVEMIVGPLTRAGCTQDGPGGGGIMILAIYIAQFNDLETHYREVEALVEWVHSARPLPGFQRIYAPGEKEEEIRLERLRQGIELPEPTWQELVAIAAELNVTILDA